jgi:hypothetical protein
MLVTNVWLQMATNTLHPFVMAASVAAFILFAPTSAFFLSHIGNATITPPARNLLLLRVFGYTRRTERLFDRIAARWRLFGPVTMIVAPDIAARTIDPADYLRWLTERTDEFFVTSRADLTARLLALDMAPDPTALSCQRVLLPRQHVAGHRGRVDTAGGCGGDGRSGVTGLGTAVSSN